MFKFDEEKFLAAVENLNRQILLLGETMGQAISEAQPFAIQLLANLHKIFVFDWQRMEYETDDEYAQRLADDDWLDNPNARWEYQKIVWMTPVRIVRRWLGHE